MAAGKAKVRFNIVDFLVVVAILAAILALILRGPILKRIGRVVYNDEAVLSVRIAGLTVEQAEGIRQGDLLYLSGDELGKIASCSSSESHVVVFEEDGNGGGRFVRADDPGHFDVVCSINIKGAANSDGFYIFGSMYVGVGQTLLITSDTYSYEVTVVSIT